MYKKIFYVLCLLLFCNTVFADTTSATLVSDQSIAYLSMIFGQVGSSLSNISGHMLGHIFLMFNKGLLIVALAVLMYNVIFTSIKTSIEGQLITPQRNFFLIALRVTLGFAFLVPFSDGYNLSQRLLINVIIQSVNVANTAWDSALTYLDNGGALFISPSSSGTGTSGMLAAAYKTALINSTETKKNSAPIIFSKTGLSTLSVSGKILADELCMYSSQITASNPNGGVSYLQPQEGNKSIVFPNSSAVGSNGCGSVNYATLLGTAGSKKGISTLQQQRVAASNIVNTLLPAAKYLFCQANAKQLNFNAKEFTRLCTGFTDPSNVTPKPSESNISSSMVDAFIGYSSDIQPVLLKSHAADNASQLAFIPDAKTEGWAMAGSYYWKFISISSTSLSHDNWASYVSNQAVALPSNTSLSIFNDPNVNTVFSAARSKVDTIINNEVNASTKGAPAAYNNAAQWGADLGGSAASAISIVPIVGQIVGIMSDFSIMAEIINPNSGLQNQNPILMLHTLGVQCISTAGDLFFSVLIACLVMGLATMFCKADADLSAPLLVAISWLQPLVMVLSVALIGVGLFLAYYVSIYPFLIWIFALLGWLVACIEGMVAMPLVAIGVTHPEGHDMLGRAEQATMLGVGLFIRPVAMVIGLIAAMILSYVGYYMLIYSFGTLLSNLFTTGGTGGGTGSGMLMHGMSTYLGTVMTSTTDIFGMLLLAMLSFPVLLIIYCSLVWVITQQCYSLVSVIPENLMRWIGGPQTPSMMNPMQMAGQVGSAVQSAGSQIGSAMQDTTREKLRESRAQGLQTIANRDTLEN